MSKIAFLISNFGRRRVFKDQHIDRLSALGELSVYDRDDFLDREYVLDFVKGAEVIITSWQSPAIDEEILALCPDLRMLIHAAGSVKPVVTPALIERGIRVASSANELSRGVAETTLGLALAACKGAFFLPNDMKKGMWNENNHKIKDFYNIKIGVIGAGFAGRYFIKLLRDFRVDILVYDPTLTKEQIRDELGAEKRELSELLAESDVISIHAPSIPETDNMLNETNIPLIRDGSILINTARGKLIDEAALIKECAKNRFTAILDVYWPEPPAVDNPLRKMDNVVLLPHVAGFETNGAFRVGEHTCEEAERFFAGEKLECEIDLSKLSIMA